MPLCQCSQPPLFVWLLPPAPICPPHRRATHSPAQGGISLFKPPPAMARVYEAMQGILANEPDLLRELNQYVPSSCYNTGHVHTVLPTAH